MHTNHFTGMAYGNIKPGRVVPGQLGLNTGGVANKEKGNSELTGSGDGTLDFDGRSVIATHHINGNSHGILNGSNRQLTG
jgi:hypothetical protein